MSGLLLDIFKVHCRARRQHVKTFLATHFNGQCVCVRTFQTYSSLLAARKKMATQSLTVERKSQIKEQYFDYFLILDFEATCKENEKIYPQEIIEFPVIKINAKTLQVESTFHQYVEPKVYKELTPFCTQLTGIIQDMVDGKPHLEETLQSFDKWMLDNKLLGADTKSLFVTCGDWDLKTMLPSQCSYFKIPVPKYFGQWLNIKKGFAEVTGSYPREMMGMLSSLQIPHQGRHHSGIDDCKNIGNILVELLHRGYVAKASCSNR
ncbi:ERI1 exoribonuclease 3-like [Dreissena polymorpha]|nr:ERI1 exoribonuclease 3-like [Dreissena polymorpha]